MNMCDKKLNKVQHHWHDLAFCLNALRRRFLHQQAQQLPPWLLKKTRNLLQMTSSDTTNTRFLFCLVKIQQPSHEQKCSEYKFWSVTL